MNVVVVIAAYNEQKTVGAVVSGLRERGYRTVVVDDGSIDSTAELARAAGATVLRHVVNCGQGAALQTGITYALGADADIIVTFDADGQFDPTEVASVIAPLKEKKCEVVLGSRFHKSLAIPPARRMILRLAAAVTRLYTGLRVSDAHNGFRAFSKSAAEKIHINHDGMAHASEIIEQLRKYKLSFVEVPVTVSYTEYSLAKGQKIANSLKIIWDLFIGRLTGK